MKMVFRVSGSIEGEGFSWMVVFVWGRPVRLRIDSAAVSCSEPFPVVRTSPNVCIA